PRLLHFVSILACPQVSLDNFGTRSVAGGANRRERRALPVQLPWWRVFCGPLCASRRPSAGGSATATWSTTGKIASTRPAAPWLGGRGCWERFIRLISRPSRPYFGR